jgi:hypothetical protein
MTEEKGTENIISNIAKELIREGYKVELSKKDGVYTVGLAVEEEATSETMTRRIKEAYAMNDGAVEKKEPNLNDYYSVQEMKNNKDILPDIVMNHKLSKTSDELGHLVINPKQIFLSYKTSYHKDVWMTHYKVHLESKVSLEGVDHMKIWRDSLKAMKDHVKEQKEPNLNEYISVKEITLKKSIIEEVTDGDLEIMQKISKVRGYEVLNVSCFLEQFETEEMMFHKNIWLEKLKHETNCPSTIAIFSDYIDSIVKRRTNER